MATNQPVERIVPISESEFEVKDSLLKSTGTQHDIPKAYMEEYEAEAVFKWRNAKKLLSIAGDDFTEAESYLADTIDWCVNLTRGRQGMNVVTVLGRDFLPKRTPQGYDIPKDITPKPPKMQDPTYQQTGGQY